MNTCRHRNKQLMVWFICIIIAGLVNKSTVKIFIEKNNLSHWWITIARNRIMSNIISSFRIYVHHTSCPYYTKWHEHRKSPNSLHSNTRGRNAILLFAVQGFSITYKMLRISGQNANQNIVFPSSLIHEL